MLSKCGAREDSWESQRKPILNIHWKGWCGSWNSNILVTWYEELTHWKRPWCWGRLKAEGEGDDRGWDGWRASPTQCTWAWANSGRRRGKPGCWVLRSQRVRHDSVEEQHIYMESRKMVLMNLFVEQEYTCSHREQTCGYSRERRRGKKLRAALTYIHFYTLSSVQSLSHVRLFATPWTAARQASLSITNS